ncbi:microsomal triglyceride transfer protein large subunit-like [Tubulanus polymorphus]|uniref:microsomal triglyceride transfer protein large subunit-like n=1 Tax=Tubulanus polymorphus TaxID=672921 RepID=UPI003DA5012C
MRNSIRFSRWFLLMCAVCGFVSSYKSGVRYVYNYETSVIASETVLKKEYDVGFKLSATVEMDALWTKETSALFRMQVFNVKLNGVKSTEPGTVLPYATLSKYPIYFLRKDGRVTRVYITAEEEIAAQNIKNGIISLFQYQTKSEIKNEVDISGECTVEYEVHKNTVTKTKSDCSTLEIAGQNRNYNKVLDISDVSNMITIYELDADGSIKVVTATETHDLSIPTHSKIANQFLQMQHLVQVSTGSCESIDGDNPQEAAALIKDSSTWKIFEMLPTVDDEEGLSGTCDQCLKPGDLVAKLRGDLDKEKLGHLEAAGAFVKLVASFRQTGKKEIVKVLKDPKNKDIFTELIDVVAAAQTVDAVDAMLELVDFNSEDSQATAERMFMALSYATHPDDLLMEKLLDVVKKGISDEKIQRSAALALGALIKTFAQNIQANDQIIQDYQNYLLDQLTACLTAECKIDFLTALGNSRLHQPLPTLLRLAETSQQRSVSLAALKAISYIESGYITDEVKEMLLNIFLQTSRRYDTTVRVAALSIVLRNKPTLELLENAIVSLKSERQKELKTYVLAIVEDLASKDACFQKIVSQLRNNSKVVNYDSFAQNGGSSSYTGTLSALTDADIKYSLNVENSKAGIMKNSDFDVYLKHKDQRMLPIISLNLYADGLESLAGGEDNENDNYDDESKDETVEATAGMVLSLLDVSLPPLQFFKGQSELMSAVWYAPSTLTPVVQGTILLHDYNRAVHLQNGLIVKHSISSGLSFDLSGAISISLWNRNANSLVESSGALFLLGTSSINVGGVRVGLEFTSRAESYMDSITDVEFYEAPFKMCLQMNHPEFTQTYTFEQSESLPAMSVTPYKKRTSIQHKINAVSFPLHRKNNEQCRILLDES